MGIWPNVPTCSFCNAPSLTSFEMQAGNNAEIWVPIELCQAHMEENDKDENAFDAKYADRLNELAPQREIR